MSARITIHCDRTWRDGSCTAQLMTDARTLTEAREAASRVGWRIHPGGTEFCPGHSGQPGTRPGVNVVHLHPEKARPQLRGTDAARETIRQARGDEPAPAAEEQPHE